MTSMVTDITPILQQAFPQGKPEMSATEFDKALKFVQGRRLGTINRPGRNSMNYVFWAHTMIVEWRLLVDEWEKAGKIGVEPKFLLCPECRVMLVADLSQGDVLVCGGGCHRAITVNTFVQLFRKPYVPPTPTSRPLSQSAPAPRPILSGGVSGASSSPNVFGLSQQVPKGERPEDYGIHEEVKKGKKPLVGWRMWDVLIESRDEGWRLKAISRPVIWEPYVPMRGTCNNKPPEEITDHKCPSWEHRCGVHAVKEVFQVRKWGSPTNGPKAQHVRLLGEIDLWGRVLEYEEGYRAEWGYPAKLYLPSELPDIFQAGPEGLSAQELADELWAAYLTEVVIDDQIFSIP